MLKTSIIGIVLLVAGWADAYQIWTSTCRTPAFVLERTDQWDRVAAQVKGLNINFTSTDYYPGEQPGPNNWPLILSTYATASSQTFQPFTRSAWENDWGPAGEGLTLDDALPRYLARGDAWGYTISLIMLYDIRLESGGPIYWWNPDDITEVRNWLDNNGYSHVKLMWNVRQDNARERDLSAHPGVDAVLMEANFEHWETNDGNRWGFLQWFTTTYPNRDVVFQLHTFGEKTKDEYTGIRRFVRSISADILGSTDFVRSDHCIVLPMTYVPFHEYWSFLPEHEPAGDLYGDSMTGLLLSLIEQKDLFEGTAPGGLISSNQCSSFDRTYDLYAAVADGSLTNTATWGRAAPVAGDTNIWQSAGHWIGSHGLPNASTLTFHGETLVIQPGGLLAQAVNTTTFSMRNLVLDGGAISHSELGSTTLNLNGDTLYLNAGQIQAGGASSNQNISFKNAGVSGSGTVNITAKGAGGSQIDFQSTVDLTGFSGTFAVLEDGILNLPAITIGSFGIDLSGSGRYRLDDEVAVFSLVIDGADVPAGTYAYSDFPTSQQDNLIDGGGTIHVRSSRTAIQSGTLDEGATWGVVLPTYADEDTHRWHGGINRLGVSDKEAFEGGGLVLGTGGELASDKANAILWIRDLTLEGGTISNQKTAPFYINLRGHVLTLNSGFLLADSGAYNTDLFFQNATLAGSGTIEIAGTRANDLPEVRFDASVDTSGFSGTFLVTDNGVLALPNLGTPSFSITLAGSGKYKFDSNIVVNDLMIDGVSLDPGIYYYDDLTTAQQAHLVESNGRIVVFAPFVCVQGGALNDPVIWGGIAPPVAGDTNLWRSLDYSLNAGGAAWSNVTFQGDTLWMEPGSMLNPGAAGQTLLLNNLILDDATICNNRLNAFTLDLTGHWMRLVQGTIRAGIKEVNRDLIVKNARLTGFGTIDVEAGDASGAEVRFESTVDTVGFTGLFNVQSNGILNLPPISTPSFGIRLSGSGRLVLDDDIAVTSLEIDGKLFADGSYTYADFTSVEQFFLINNGGGITVDAAANPPGSIVISSKGSSTGIGLTDLSVYATYTLQHCDDLTSSNWVDIASTTGVQSVQWQVPSTSDALFMRVVSP
ncbi:hypothetical protein [Pontiella desulfatans]|nr:hypothetical protein [Pontiella desulfatans]